MTYDGDVLPQNSTPVFDQNGTADTVEISPAGFLHVSGSTGQKVFWSRTDTTLSNTVGMTLEVRLKVIAGETEAVGGHSTFSIEGLATTAQVQVFSDRVLVVDALSGTDNYVMDTTNTYHIYRITLLGDVVKVYVDGTLRINVPVASGGALQLVEYIACDTVVTLVETSLDYWNVTYSANYTDLQITPKVQDVIDNKPSVSLDNPRPMIANLQNSRTERLYPYVQTVGMYMGLPFGLTYNQLGTVYSPYAP